MGDCFSQERPLVVSMQARDDVHSLRYARRHGVGISLVKGKVRHPGPTRRPAIDSVLRNVEVSASVMTRSLQSVNDARLRTWTRRWVCVWRQ